MARPTPSPYQASRRRISGLLAVARRLVVLGGPEPLGLEAEHHHEQRQADRDEPARPARCRSSTAVA